MMWNRHEIVRTGGAIIIMLAVAVLLRLIIPPLDYFPPENLVREPERSWFVASMARLLLVPTTLTQFALLFGLGMWAGAM